MRFGFNGKYTQFLQPGNGYPAGGWVAGFGGRKVLGLTLLCAFAASAAAVSAAGKRAYVATGTLPAPEANQAAAADRQWVYAIDNGVVAKYDRVTGNRVGVSTGRASHLNSGFLWEGRLYCAHSNYPKKPERSEIMVLDPASMQLRSFKNFGEYRGSLTWVLRKEGAWWCNFAHYGAENGKTVLVKLDDNWKELGAWTYPVEVVRDLGRMSLSGGIWQGDDLLATGHDKQVIYRLRLPDNGTVLQLMEVIASPFPGQGIAVDPATGGLVGIERAKRRVVFAALKEE